jgi:penicillin-binding protein 1C
MRHLIWITLTSTCLLYFITINNLHPTPETLSVANSTVRKVQFLDRYATPLTITYQNDWNLHEYRPLHEIPELLQQIFILAEDKRFYQHNGSDWWARWHALLQNIIALRKVRGASTITEQTVRILHPRPRTIWSRWLEGFEAARMEQRFSKADILEFYLNQVPYASNRRGVAQAARYYFDRDLDTLNMKEMMALSVLVRSPGRLDLRRGTTEIEAPIARLAVRLLNLGIINQADYDNILKSPLRVRDSNLLVPASHFIKYIETSQPVQDLHTLGRLRTSLDGNLQRTVGEILNQRVQNLRHKNVNNGAVLVVNHQSHEVLAWVGNVTNTVSNQIDAVTTPRQPGSTLKPFLYALALEKGWTAATLINDSPLAEAVGTGLHSYRNYSHHYYGPLRLRDALGNSLNIPAVRTIQFVGTETFLQRLHQLGMKSLTQPADYYGDGLALGNGGITLFELVQAYATLANQGRFNQLKVLINQANKSESRTVFSPEVSSIIADILSDSDARHLEFGRSALLRFPVQTAVKTGTSTDYRDAWSVGFNHRYTVGVWLGNLDQQPMSKVSGGSGAVLVLRAIFAELNRYEKTQALYKSPKLLKINICRATGQLATKDCPSKIEWFIAGTEPKALFTTEKSNLGTSLYLKQPTPGLQLAMDPRIPDEYEAFALKLSATELEAEIDSIEWLIDGKVIGKTPAEEREFFWPVKRGTHIAQARIWTLKGDKPLQTEKIRFDVK